MNTNLKTQERRSTTDNPSPKNSVLLIKMPIRFRTKTVFLNAMGVGWGTRNKFFTIGTLRSN